MLTRIKLAEAIGVGLLLCGCGTAAPDSGDAPTETEAPSGNTEADTALPLELPAGQKLVATVRTETSSLYFVAAEHGINILEIGETSRFAPVMARLAAPATALEIYLTLTGDAESEAPEALTASHYGALETAPRPAEILPTAVLQERALNAFAGSAEIDVSGMADIGANDALIDKAAPQRLAFNFGSGAPADCTGPLALFIAYYGHLGVTGLEPTFAGCAAPNVCVTTGSGTHSESGAGTFRTAAGCNGKAISASVTIMTEKNAPFCPPCPPALPYRGPLFLLGSGRSFLYVETGGDFAGSMSVTAGASGAGTLATIALH